MCHSDLLLRAIATVLKLGPGAVAERRVFHCNRILKRITELEQQEKEFHDRLHPQVRSVLKGKNLLIWRELLVETGYPDLEIFDEVTDGIRLVGPACESGAFPSGLTPSNQLSNFSPREGLLLASVVHLATVMLMWSYGSNHWKKCNQGGWMGHFMTRRKYLDWLNQNLGYALAGSL